MRGLLKALVLIFGLVCCGIAITHILFGHASVPGSAPGFSPTDDSEDRFYATLFLGFGVAMAWCSRNLIAREQAFAALLITFFAGGIARIISAIQLGLPIPMFIALGALELVMPPLLWWWHRATLANLQTPA